MVSRFQLEGGTLLRLLGHRVFHTASYGPAAGCSPAAAPLMFSFSASCVPRIDCLEYNLNDLLLSRYISNYFHLPYQ